MFNPWMTITIRSGDQDINMRLIILTLYKQFEPAQWKSRLNFKEDAGKETLTIQMSNKENVDRVLSFLEKNNIRWI